MSRKVLVTGGAGFIGSHTVDALLARGDEVRILDSLEPPVHRDARPPAYLRAGVELVRGNVLDRAALTAALEGVSGVVHLAAYQDYLTDFSKFFQVNVAGTALLYELIVNRRLPVERVVVASSQATYGEGAYRCPRDGRVYPDQRSEVQLQRREWELRCARCGEVLQPEWTDESVVRPHNSYAMSKYGQEQLAINLGRRYGIPTAALRYSIVQGPRQSFYNAYSGALRVFVTRLLNGKAPVIFEDGAQLRDYVWIGDVVTANLLCLDDPRTDYQVYNVGGDHRFTVRELFEICRQACGVEVEASIPGVYRFGDTRHVFSDVSSLKALGWRTTRDRRAVVEAYVAWAREQPEVPDTFAEAEKKMRATGVLREARGTPTA
jgi:dTDP-L-rhamnose 4-epimerase